MLGMSWASGSAYSLAAAQSAYVDKRPLTAFLHFNTATFLDIENASGSESVNVFNPSALNIDQWIAALKSAKMTGACITPKHHPGWCMWNTASTPYNLFQSSWYASNQIDILAQFTTKCRAAGIAPEFYWCPEDAQITQFFTKAQTRAYMELQLTELLTRYGPIAAIWLDRAEPAFGGTAYPWDSVAQRNAFIKSLQPFCLIVNNSKTNTLNDTDIIVYELSGFPTAGNTIPSEVAEPGRADSQWFWKSADPNSCISSSTALSNLAQAKAGGASLRINCGPDSTGNLPSAMVTMLAALGAGQP